MNLKNIRKLREKASFGETEFSVVIKDSSSSRLICHRGVNLIFSQGSSWHFQALPKTRYSEKGERPFPLTFLFYERRNIHHESSCSRSFVSHCQDWTVCPFWNYSQTRRVGLGPNPELKVGVTFFEVLGFMGRGWHLNEVKIPRGRRSEKWMLGEQWQARGSLLWPATVVPTHPAHRCSFSSPFAS